MLICFTYDTRGKDVVEILEESFFFDVLIGEYERDPFALLTRHTVQKLEILQKVRNSISSEWREFRKDIKSFVVIESHILLFSRENSDRNVLVPSIQDHEIPPLCHQKK